MTFTHDTQIALNAAAALVNTDPGSGSGEDPLITLAGLQTFLDDVGWRSGRSRDEAELHAVRALRPQLRELWLLGELALVERVNEILLRFRALPQVVEHDDLGWHIHAVPRDAPLATQMVVEAAMAMTDVLRAGELDRLKTCAAADCDAVVVDLSRNRSKRFCEGGCGNRENVRAYRDRLRGEEA